MATEAQENAFTLAPLNYEAAIERMGSLSLFRDIAQMFYERLDANLTELRANLNAGKMKDALIMAHSLKSNLATLGAEDLSALATQIEKACKETRQTEAQELFKIIEDNAAQLKAALKAV